MVKVVNGLQTAGAGHPGYCKLCSFVDPKLQDQFDQRVLDYTAGQLNDWLASRQVATVNKETIYKHRKHVQNPKDKFVTAIARREQAHGVQPARVSEQDFLDAVVSQGLRRVIDSPDEVTINHALKATQIKTASKSKGDAHNILIQLFTGRVPAGMAVLEGEYQET
jgi:hypothetical protein